MLQFILNAQSKLYVKVTFNSSLEKFEKKFPDWKVIDSSRLTNFVQEVKLFCFEHDFLTAHVQLAPFASDSVRVLVELGKTYVLNRLNIGNVPPEWLGSYYKTLLEKPVKLVQVKKYLDLILQAAENNGYPFAEIGLDSIIADSIGIQANLAVTKNSLIIFDSIDFGGTAKVNKDFLQQFANFKPGSPYQESLIQNIDNRLSELPYVQVVRPMGIYFYGNKAKPYVYINQRKASSFDGVIGFAPNSQLNNKLVLTGDMNLKLANLFGSGKNFELTYRGYLANSQDLQIKFLWPYFFKTKLALDYSFKLAKFDTSWIEIWNDIGLQYRLGGNDYIKFFVQNQRVNSFISDTQFVKVNKRLPAIHDVVNSIYGLALRKSTLDYYFNPRKGYLCQLEIGAGTKRIIPIDDIAALNIENSRGETYKIYDSISMQSLQYKMNLNFSYYRNLYGNFVLHSQLNSGLIMNENLFLNELYRIGGLKTLKGFDEQSIFANKYAIANIELKYLFQQNSGFMIFWNGAWYENSILPRVITDTPWGAGAGLNLETGAGVFSLYYAVGKQLGNPLEIQRAKIHFGFVNFF